MRTGEAVCVKEDWNVLRQKSYTSEGNLILTFYYKQLLLSGQGHWNLELDVNFPKESLFPNVFYIYL